MPLGVAALGAAGSGTPQCAVIGWPGQNGHTSLAALSQTVNTKSKCGRARRGELIPALGAQAGGRMVHLLQQVQRERMHLALGMAAGAEALEPTLSLAIEDAFGQDAARRIAGAQEQDVVDMLRHGLAPVSQTARGQGRLHQLLAALRMAAAAILHQKLDQRPRAIQVRAIEDRASLPFRRDQPGAVQDREMAGQGARRHIQVVCKIACRNRLRREPDQLPEDFETGVLGQRTERGERLLRFHISRMVETLVCVNSAFRENRVTVKRAKTDRPPERDLQGGRSDFRGVANRGRE